MRILIADDDAVSRRLLEATLKRLGYEVVVVEDGEQARDALLAADGPSLAILDWMMPGLDGLEVCRTVRATADHYVYVILLTALHGGERIAEGLGAEADDFLAKPFDVAELRARVTSGERVLELQERLLAAQEGLRHDATHDRLTALWNRGMILDHLEHELGEARRCAQPLGIAIVDLDHFKSINDSHGHGAGDSVLREIAHRMRQGLRAIDAVGRYGGEEFLIVMPACTARDAAAVVERLRAAVGSEPVAAGPARLTVTVSAGLAWSAAGTETSADLIQAADSALYHAKADGRDRLVTADRRPAIGPPECAQSVGPSLELPGPASSDRRDDDGRRSPRLDARGQLVVKAATLGDVVQVHDISAGGFLIESTSAVPVGATHRFWLEHQHGMAPVLLEATAVHCRQTTASVDVPHFLVGFAFRREDPGSDEAIARLLDELLAAVSFD